MYADPPAAQCGKLSYHFFLVFFLGRSPLSPWPEAALRLAFFLRSWASERPASSASSICPCSSRRTKRASPPVDTRSLLAAFLRPFFLSPFFLALLAAFLAVFFLVVFFLAIACSFW